jgi:MFS family permease
MDKFGWTASKSGLIFVMLSFSILFDPYIGHLTDRHGCRGLTVLGLLIGIITWSLLCLATSNSTAIIILLSALLFFVGIAAGLMITPNMVEISHAVDFMSQTSQGSSSDPAKVMARAYSLLNMSWGIGSVVGPLWAGAVIETRGWQGMCVSFVVLQLITTGLAYRFAGQQIEKTEGGNQNQI